MPLLLNVVEIVEVAALPLLVKVPRLFTTAVAAGVGATELLVKMLSPLLVVWSLNVAPLAIVRMPEPGSPGARVGAVQVDLDMRSRRRAGAAQLQASARHPARSPSC